VSASNAEMSEYVLVSDQQNIKQNPYPNITIVLCGNAVQKRTCILLLIFESVNNTVQCMFARVIICCIRYLCSISSNIGGPGVAYWLRHCATSWTFLGSIPIGDTGDILRGTPDRTMCPDIDSASESDYKGFLLG